SRRHGPLPASATLADSQRPGRLAPRERQGVLVREAVAVGQGSADEAAVDEQLTPRGQGEWLGWIVAGIAPAPPGWGSRSVPARQGSAEVHRPVDVEVIVVIVRVVAAEGRPPLRVVAPADRQVLGGPP